MIEPSRFHADDTAPAAPAAAAAPIVQCPECGSAIELEEALTKAIREQAVREAHARAEQKFKMRIREERARAREDAAAAARLEIEAATERALRAERESGDAKQRELAPRKELESFEQDKRDWELTKAREREALRAEAVRAAEKAAAEAQAEELRRKDEEFARQLQQKDEERELQLKQRDVEREGLQRQIEELTRKVKQGSQQSQGEALEVTLEELLQREFPGDAIEPVPKGITGADVVQRVRTESGVDCGTILWEAKRTKHWTAAWLPKLRDDQRVALLELEQRNGPEYWLTTDNFYTITRYNRSPLYAMAVFQLSEAIRNAYQNRED